MQTNKQTQTHRHTDTHTPSNVLFQVPLTLHNGPIGAGGAGGAGGGGGTGGWPSTHALPVQRHLTF